MPNESISLKPKTPKELSFLNQPGRYLYNSFIDEKNKQENAALSGNTLIAGSGLGVGYTAVHIITLWDFYLEAGSEVAIGLLSGSAIPYFFLSYWHAKIIYKKNLLYEQSKEEKQRQIEELKRKINNELKLLNQTLDDLEYEFTKRYQPLIDFNNTQAWFESFKKITRAVMLFTIVLALEFSGFGSLTDVMIAALVIGGVAGIIDYRAQKKESRHDVKLRELHEQTVALKKKYVALKQAKAEKSLLSKGTKQDAPIELKNLLIRNPVDKQHQYTWRDYLFTKDNALAVIGVTSGYAAFGAITLFEYHDYMVKQGTYTPLALEASSQSIEFLLFGIPLLLATVIDVVNIYRNYHLYKFYADEEHLVKQKIEALKESTEKMIKQYTFSSDVQYKLSQYLKTMPDPSEADRHEVATFYKKSEAFKKGLRIFTMSFLFFGSSLLAPEYIITVICIAILITYMDYRVRTEKEMKEKNINDLKEQELKLLGVQEILMDNTCKSGMPGIKLNLEPKIEPKIEPKKSESIATIAESKNTIAIIADEEQNSGKSTPEENLANVPSSLSPAYHLSISKAIDDPQYNNDSIRNKYYSKLAG